MVNILLVLIFYTNNVKRILKVTLFNETVELSIVLKFPIHPFITIILNRVSQCKWNLNGIHQRWIIFFSIKLVQHGLGMLEINRKEDAIVTSYVK